MKFEITHPADLIFSLLTVVIGSIVLVLGELPTEFLVVQLMFVLLQTFRLGYTSDKKDLI